MAEAVNVLTNEPKHGLKTTLVAAAYASFAAAADGKMDAILVKNLRVGWRVAGLAGLGCGLAVGALTRHIL